MFDDAVTDSSVSAEIIQKIGTFNCAISLTVMVEMHAKKKEKIICLYF
jgi:hypothetical protein